MPPASQVIAIPILKPTKTPTVPRERKPSFKSISVAAVRREVAKRLPTVTKVGSSSWEISVTPSSLLKEAKSVSVNASIVDADKVAFEFAAFSEGQGHLAFLVEGLKPGNPVVLCHSFFFQPPKIQLPKEVSVTVDAEDVTQEVTDEPFGDFKAVLLPKGSTALVTVKAEVPFTWFWRETLFATLN